MYGHGSFLQPDLPVLRMAEMRLGSPDWSGGESRAPKGASQGALEATAWEVNLVPNNEIMEKCYTEVQEGSGKHI